MRANGQCIGIDVGGTFTDFVVLDASGLTVHKVPTTPSDQSQAILQGLAVLSVDPEAPVMHGTTTATNALLERRGARTALITTHGFADVLAIGRQNRPQLYEFSQATRNHLVPRQLRMQVDERIDSEGNIHRKLDRSSLSEVLGVLKQEKVESVAVALLFSFLNDVHERGIAAALAEDFPDVPVSLSVDLLPEYREYERTATTVINAYVRPLVMRYLTRLRRVLSGRSLKVMQSSGGTLDAQQASKQASRLVLSGPAGGVVGAFALARQALSTSSPHIITFDMGGTSTDVALCPGGIPQTTEGTICDLPLRLPSTQIHTVGAGGGSLAYVDSGGILRVGPQSAGAVPGPVCYGQGGQTPTVTDANLVLGRLIPSHFLGGDSARPLDVQAAYRAIAHLGQPLELSPEETALGIVRVANATMERAIRRVSVECGYDPRSYVLVPFGGAGPLHACAIAESLGVKKILISRYPGVLSALGLLMADITSDVSQALLSPAKELLRNPERLENSINQLKPIVLSRLDSDTGESQLDCSLDLRYSGQSYELTVPLSLPVAPENIRISIEAFHSAHHMRYGYSAPELPVESVAVRLRATAPREKVIPTPATPTASPFNIAQAPQAPVYFTADGPMSIPVLKRDILVEGCMFRGPALIVQYDSTVVMPPGWDAEVDQWQNLHLKCGTGHGS